MNYSQSFWAIFLVSELIFHTREIMEYDKYISSTRIFIHSVVNIFYNKGNAKISECVKF